MRHHAKNWRAAARVSRRRSLGREIQYRAKQLSTGASRRPPHNEQTIQLDEARRAASEKTAAMESESARGDVAMSDAMPSSSQSSMLLDPSTSSTPPAAAASTSADFAADAIGSSSSPSQPMHHPHSQSSHQARPQSPISPSRSAVQRGSAQLGQKRRALGKMSSHRAPAPGAGGGAGYADGEWGGAGDYEEVGRRLGDEKVSRQRSDEWDVCVVLTLYCSILSQPLLDDRIRDRYVRGQSMSGLILYGWCEAAR
ncbi:hypothetical protein V8E36_001555 [Tilletia maclaganii]